MSGRPNRIIAACTDRAGRTVVLEEDRWDHVLKGGGRKGMAGLELAVMRVVEDPDRIFKGNYEGAEKLYKANLGPARWLAVVVEYDGLQGRVITVHPSSDKEPRGDPL